MAANPVPDSYPSLIVQFGEAFAGADTIGSGIPLLINTAAVIGPERSGLMTAQTDYRMSRSAVVPLQTARRSAVETAYAYCQKTRDVLYNYLGRQWSEAWIAAGWLDTLEIPQSFDGLYDLTYTLTAYFTAHPTQECEDLGVTSAAAQAAYNALVSTNTAVINAEAVSTTKRNVRDAALTTARKRLSGLCKELSQRLEPLDPRWRQFGFNMPGAATVPAVPEQVAVVPQPGSRLQISCDPSPNATSYRFYVQRPIVDPEPILAGSATEPLFVSEPLEAGQVYQVYVSAVNEGAESELSEPVNATPLLAQAA